MSMLLLLGIPPKLIFFLNVGLSSNLFGHWDLVEFLFVCQWVHLQSSLGLSTSAWFRFVSTTAPLPTCLPSFHVPYLRVGLFRKLCTPSYHHLDGFCVYVIVFGIEPRNTP